ERAHARRVPVRAGRERAGALVRAADCARAGVAGAVPGGGQALRRWPLGAAVPRLHQAAGAEPRRRARGRAAGRRAAAVGGACGPRWRPRCWSGTAPSRSRRTSSGREALRDVRSFAGFVGWFRLSLRKRQTKSARVQKVSSQRGGITRKSATPEFLEPAAAEL